MKCKANRLIWLILFLLIFKSTLSQTDSIQFNFDGSIRYRFETWNGMNAKNYGYNASTAIGKLNDNILLQRFILGFNTNIKERYKFAFHLQDSRAFGWSLNNSQNPDLYKIKKTGTQEPYYIMNPQEEFFEIYDGYAEVKNIFSTIDIKAGRQKIFYGDYHILGPGDWGNTGRWTWDALKISYKKGKHFIDIFGGGTKIHDPEKISIPFTNTEFWGGGMYAHYEIPKIFYIEPFYAYKTAGSANYINTLDFNRQWIGTRIFNEDFHSHVFDFLAVYQFGNEASKPISAYGIFAKWGYTFKFLPTQPTLSLRESYASGGKSTDNKARTFEPAFGAGDKFYGWMNITSWSNIDDREIVLELFPKKDLWIEIKYNMFFIPVNENYKLLGNLKLKNNKHHLGDEFNVFTRYKLNKHWQFIGALGYFFPKDVELINNKKHKNAQMGALQIQYYLN